MRISANFTGLVLIGCAALAAGGCEKEQDPSETAAPATETKQQPAQPGANLGIEVSDAPCRLEVDSPADGEVDGIFEISYEDGRPARVHNDFGEGGELNSCISFGYEDGLLVSKTTSENGCDEPPNSKPDSTFHRLEGSNLVELTFSDADLRYHYATVPGDFTFLVTRTAYNLGPQTVSNVEIDQGRFQSLELSGPEETHTLEATYRGGELIRLSERDSDDAEVGYASFVYRDGRLVKVERKLRTMQQGQVEVVRLSYDCEATGN